MGIADAQDSLLASRLADFVENECIPAEEVFNKQLDQLEKQHGSRWVEVPQVMSDLKRRAQEQSLWNLFMPSGYPGSQDIPMEEYAKLSEIMGRSFLAPEACNCGAPDTGNMEVLAKYGTPEQQQRWLTPLLQGTIRSAFLMTEPDVASSDATNISCSIRRQGGNYVINGRKWWSSGAMDPRCKVLIVMGRMDESERSPRHQQHSIVVVPADAVGVQMVRPLTVFGYDDAPHGHAEVLLTDVKVPCSSIILGEGRGFEIAQGRLGPGRVHHCMRAIGMAERALSLLMKRSLRRKTFGKLLADHDGVRDLVSKSRIAIDQARLLVLDCAAKLERDGLQRAIQAVSMIKVAVPTAVCQVLDRAIQVHGGAGVSSDTFLAKAYAHMRTLRIADGPDEVHLRAIAKQEYKKASQHSLSRL
ncbi:unnamed protein product [Chrysoparadoxa australica]